MRRKRVKVRAWPGGRSSYGDKGTDQSRAGEKGRSDEYVLKCEEGGYEEMCEISEKIYRHGIGYLRCAMP